MDVRRIRADEWRLWRDARLRMLREESAYFSTRYEDVVREPAAVWQTWAAEAAEGVDKVLFVAEDGGALLGVVGAFRRLDPAAVQLVSLWVDPNARGRGVARSLIQAVAGWAHGSTGGTAAGLYGPASGSACKLAQIQTERSV